MNMQVTNIDHGSVGMGGNEFADDTLNLGAGEELTEGLILARSTAADATVGQLVKYDPAGTDGADTPRAVLPHDYSGASGENAVRVIVSGTVKTERLNVDGSDPATTDLDALRQTAIVPVSVEQLAQQDNQA